MSSVRRDFDNDYIKCNVLNADVILLNSTLTLDNTLDMQGNKILNLGNPTLSTDAVNKIYVDTISDNFTVAGNTKTNISTNGSDTVAFAATPSDPSTSVVYDNVANSFTIQANGTYIISMGISAVSANTGTGSGGISFAIQVNGSNTTDVQIVLASGVPNQTSTSATITLALSAGNRITVALVGGVAATTVDVATSQLSITRVAY